MPLKPGSQTQVKFPAGWLMQRPRAPQTLEGMFCMPSESLVATAMLQLSIAVKNKPKTPPKKTSFRFSVFSYYRSIPAFSPLQIPLATLTWSGLAILFEPFTHLSFVAFRTRTVEVLFHAMTLGLILTRVWITGIRRWRAWDLWKKQEKRGGKDKQNIHIKRVTVPIIRPMMAEKNK